MSMNIPSPRSRRDGQTEKEHPSWNPFGQYKGGSAHSPRHGQRSQGMGTWAAALGEKVSAEELRVFCQHSICTPMELGEGSVWLGEPCQAMVSGELYEVSQAAAAGRRPRKRGWLGWEAVEVAAPRSGQCSCTGRLLPQRQSCDLTKRLRPGEEALTPGSRSLVGQRHPKETGVPGPGEPQLLSSFP